MPGTIYFATRNQEKVPTLKRRVTGGWRVEPLPVEASSEWATTEIAVPRPGGAEDGVMDAAASNEIPNEVTESLLENAERKAILASAYLPGELVVATDGGLVFPGLGTQWNPIVTRRFAGEDATDIDRARSLLELAKDVGGADREISWQEALALAMDGQLLASWLANGSKGQLATSVAEEAVEGANGFWVSALWELPDADGRRLSELSDEERTERTDHWRQLGEALSEWLQGWESRLSAAATGS